MKPSEPIKIMRIIARLNVGGPSIHVILLTEKMHQPDFDSTLVCGNVGAAEGDMIYLAAEKGVTPIILPELGREISPRHDLFTLWQLYRLMRRLKPDVVHTHTAKAGFVGRVAAWLARVPVRVHTFHGHVFHGYFSPAKTRLFLWLERLCARLSTRVITISPRLRDELVETYRIAPPEKFKVVSLGFDLSVLAAAKANGKSDFRSANHIAADKPVIGIIGRLVPIKNHGLFIEAARRVLDQKPDVHFAIVGDGECRAEIEAQIRDLNLAGQITLVGWVQDVGSVLAGLDVLVLTSDNEGTPVSIIEAMAAQVPVIATAVGGVPDVLDGGRLGQLVPPGDAAALADAILKTIGGDYPDLVAAQQAALDRYDVGRLARELGDLYRDLLGR